MSKLVKTPILDLVSKHRVFDISKDGEGEFELYERCDQHFGIGLSREQLLQLADELRALAEPNSSRAH
jgi:hypothetical protein